MYAIINHQIRKRLNWIPIPISKPRAVVTLKDIPKGTLTYRNREVGRVALKNGRASGSIEEGRPILTYYNYKKPRYITRKCLEPLTKQRKQYLVNLVKELKATEESKSSGNNDF